MLDIREKEMPDFDQRLCYSVVRMTRANRYLVRQKMDKLNNIKKKACWKQLLAVRDEGRREKNKVRRCFEILRRYKLFHMMRKWRRQAVIEM